MLGFLVDADCPPTVQTQGGLAARPEDPAGLGGHEHAVALPQLDLRPAWMIGIARDPVEDDRLQVEPPVG